MNLSLRRVFAALSTVAVVAGLTLVAPTGPAVAAQPKTGHFSHTYDNPATPFDVDVYINFDVAKVNGKLKVKTFTWYSYSCSVLTVSKTLAVSKNGKFKFLGLASTPGTAMIKIQVKGKFTKSGKAKVTVTDQDTTYTCGEYSATVKLEK